MRNSSIGRENEVSGVVQRLLVVIALLVLPHARDVEAQVIHLNFRDVPLQEALTSVREQAGIDIVFADRFVRDQRVSCEYDGVHTDDALECVLYATGLHVVRVRRRQYVVVKTPPSREDNASPERATLAGFVSDGESGEALSGAHVYLPELRVGTITNDGGYFALPSLPEGEYRVRISYLGYRPEDVFLSDASDPHAIMLHPAPIEGGSIVFEEDERGPSDLNAMPGLLSESVARLEALPSFPGEGDLFQALQWYPGIRKSGEVNGGLIIRGAPPDQNLYLIDGAPVYHPWHAFSLISTFQTETFKDIKLYRGGVPAEFGGRLSSVLDARMRDGSRRNRSALMALNPLSGRFVVEAPATRNSSFMVAGRRSYVDKLIGRTHPVESADGRRDTLRTGYHFYDASAKFTVRPSANSRFSVSYYHGGDDLDLRLPFDVSLDFSSWLRPADLFFEVEHRWDNRLVSTRYQYLHSQRVFVTATAYYSSYTARERALLRPTSTAVLNSDYHVDLEDKGVRVDVDFFHSLAHQVQVGVQAVARRFDSSLDATVRRSPGSIDDRRQRSRSREPELAFYVQDVWQPAERWTIRPGLRVSVFGGGVYTDLSPGLSFQYTVDPRFLVLRAGANRSVQYLHRIRDRYAFTYDLVSSRWIPAGGSIRPSSGVQLSGGFESRLLAGFALIGDAYWRAADDVLLPEDEFQNKDALIGPGIDVGALLGQHVTGQSRAYGVELTTMFEGGTWDVWLSFAGGRSLVRADSAESRRFRASPFDVPRSVRVVVARNAGNWRFTASGDFRAGNPTTVPVAQYVIGDPIGPDETYLHRPDVNNGRLPAYLRVDLGAERRFGFLGARWKAKLHLYNASGRRNVVARQYVPGVNEMHVQDRRGLPLLPLFEIELEM